MFRNEINLVGPSHWGEEYHTCIGKHQSPINIEEHNVKSVSLPPLKLNGIDNPCQSYITNNGHTGENFTVLLFGTPRKREREGERHWIRLARLPRGFLEVFFKRDPAGKPLAITFTRIKLEKNVWLRYNRNDENEEKRGKRDFAPCNYKYCSWCINKLVNHIE